MGKGSNRRNEDINKIWDNWDAIFSKKNKDEENKDIKEEVKEEPEKAESTKTK